MSPKKLKNIPATLAVDAPKTPLPDSLVQATEQISPIKQVLDPKRPSSRLLRYIARNSRTSESSTDTEQPASTPPATATSSAPSSDWDGYFRDPDFLNCSRKFSTETQFSVPLDVSVDPYRLASDNLTLNSTLADEFHPETRSPSATDSFNTASLDTPSVTQLTDTMTGDAPRAGGLADINEALHEHIRLVARARFAWVEDYEGVEAEGLPTSALNRMVERAEKYKEDLTHSMLEILFVQPDALSPRDANAADVAKAGFIGFIRSGFSIQRDRETDALANAQAPPQDLGINVKIARVLANQNSTIDVINAMTVQLKALGLGDPPDEPSYLIHHEKVGEAKAQANSILEDAQRLIDDATAAGLEGEATALDTQARLLRTECNSLSTILMDKKSTFGILTSGSRSSRSDVPPPKFSGSTDPDFFTFKNEWDQYVASKVMSEGEKYRVLTRTCLIGTAQNISKRFKTVAEVFTHLQKTFGNPRFLFHAKLDEIKKVGTCSGNDAAKRDWAVDMRSRLENIHELAINHDLVESLHINGIVGLVQSLMSQHMMRQFKKAIRKKDPTGNIARSEAWIALCEYLDTVIDELTFEINHALNNTVPSVPAEKAAARDAAKKTAPASRRQHAASSVVPPQQSLVLGTGTGPVPAATATAAGPKQKQVVKHDKIQISAAYTEPTEIICFVCKLTHTHAYYCANFQAAREKDRVSLTAKMRACFRCLRLDSLQVLQSKYRDQWYEGHKVNCKTEWTCKHGKCGKMEGRHQWHILLCCFHTDDNKQYEGQLLKTMDSAKISPTVSFYFHLPSLMYQLSTPVSAKASPDVRILNDIDAPSIFMMQIIREKQEDLLCFYDSGCGGAAISERAAVILNSACIRQGPTMLNVAGGKTLRIEGGDESFTLSLHNTDLRATLTGLKMEAVTTKFPLWTIHKAWAEIKAEIDLEHPAYPDLPAVADKLGGTPVDIMIGIRYVKYYPELLFILPSGLAVHRSQFAAPNNEILILGGPHPSWERCAERCNFIGPHSFFTAEMRAYYYSCASIRHVYNSVEHVTTGRITEVPAEPVGQAAGEGVGGEDMLRGGGGCIKREGGVVQWGEPIKPELDDPGLVDYTDLDWLSWMDKVMDYDDPDDADDEADGDPPEVRCQYVHCDAHKGDKDYVIPSNWDITRSSYSLRDTTNRYLEGELSGSEISYRCIKCRNCSSCRNSDSLEASSLREEAEQFLIEQSVQFYPEDKRLVAKLPFIHPPKTNLLPNRYTAEKVFESQLRIISRSEQMKADVLASFNKLATKGYLIPISQLPPESLAKVTSDHDAGYYIPWRVVFKEGSLSTPCRMVFDASSKTPGGMSLNDCLAKGANKLAKIHDVLLQFRSLPAAFTTDIRLAYNQVQLHPDHLRYQKFLWKSDLEPSNPTEDHVIGTLIYGVKPAGNQQGVGCGKVADHAIVEHPQHTAGATALKKAYVDDVATAARDRATARAIASSLDFTLKLANMEVKSYTFSGEAPAPDVSADGVHVGVLGMLWNPLEDSCGIDIKPLYFGKSKRGKLPDLVVGNFLNALKRNFTRRNMLGKVAGVFDPLGLVTPITSRLKLNLHSLISLKLGWDDKIPDDHLEAWVRNIEDIQDIRDVRFRRTIIPEDAASCDVDLVVSCDASQFIAIATVHAKVKLASGGYSCQLITAKSKIIKELTIPKAELRAAVLGAHLAHAVKHSLGDQCKQATYLTDSSVALHWINTDERPLEVVVRNCVIDIRRFTTPSSWFHIPTHLNIADLGTRDAAVTEIGLDSDWQNGPDWMRLEPELMPVSDVDMLKLGPEQRKTFYHHTKPPDVLGIVLPNLKSKVADRYSFAKYIVDPNKYGWARALRVTAIVIKYIHKLQARASIKLYHREWFPPPPLGDPTAVYWAKGVPVLFDWDVRMAANYYFNRCYLEVKEYIAPRDLKHVDVRNGIMYYVGRVLQGQPILAPEDVMFDLEPLSFVRPVADRYSPVAYSVMVFSHTQSETHRSATATLLASRSILYVLRGRDLAIEVREACRSCIRFKRNLLEIEMGKIHPTRLTVAPAFYHSQVDLFGPMLARCEHNHRSTIKVYGAVFKCPATCAVAVYTMTTYNTGSFILAYTRFGSRYGHPTKLFIDQGSQLMSACKTMELSITDIANSLSTQYKVGIEFSVCPVQGHNAHGMVERSILSIKTLFDKVYSGLKLDAFAYETAFAWISAQLNNLPICLGSRTDNLDSLDVITPSRLILGRGSTRALNGPCRQATPSRLVQQMDLVYDSWWNCWLTEKLADYIPKPRHWKDGNVDAEVGDIVMMLLSDKEKKLGGSLWRIGRIRSLMWSADGLTRVAVLEYRNVNETKFRTTERALSSVAILHRDSNLDVIQELNRSAREADIKLHASLLFDPF
jgi:hypothetical protein